jgi:hypothetical protein
MDNEIEKENSQNQDNELESLINSSADEEASTSSDEEVLTPEEVKALKEELKKKDSLNKQLAARLYKMKEAKTKVVESQDDTEFKKKIEFAVYHGKDLTKEEMEEVFAYAKAKNISYDDALKSPVISTYLEKSREQRKAEQAQVDVESGKSDVERKYTSEQLRSMSLEELKKIIPK